MKERGVSLGSAVETVNGKIATKIGGSAADYAISRAIANIDERVRDRLIAASFGYILQFGRGNGLKTARAKSAFRKWTDCWYTGKPGPFAEYVAGVLDGFNRKHLNIESLQDGPGLLLVNHPDGPLQGNWFTFALDEAVVQRFGDFRSAPRWFHKKHSDNPFLENTSLKIIRHRYSELLSRTCNTFLIDRNLQNNRKVIEEARKYLGSGEKVVLCYEGQKARVLTRARSGIGFLIRAVTRGADVPVYPVGAWAHGDNLNLAFGQPVDLSNNQKNRQLAHYLVGQIACLLPEDRRGYYRRYAERYIDKYQ